MDRVFLDANVLFSAAYRPRSKLARLWEIKGIELLTSAYALEEARRNLDGPDQRKCLGKLAGSMEISTTLMHSGEIAGVDLPMKDRPILLSAIGVKATHLLTGDVTHFGKYFGKTIQGVLILRPARYFRCKGIA